MTSIKKNLGIIIAFLIVLFPLISYALEKKNMDVVLVIDSTGSMKRTDPLSLRIPAAKLFISLLDENDRASVISFSDSATALSSLLSIDIENGKNALFAAIDKITSTGLHTDLYEALNKGHEVLRSEKETGREKIIVLMSDGLMDTGDLEKDRTLTEKLKGELTRMLIDNGVKVYTIAFTEQSDVNILQKVSKQTGGFYNLALTDKDFHVVFTSIFESLKTPDMLPITENGFLIDNSVEEVTIVSTKHSPDTTIQLSSPDGKKYSSGNKPPDTEWFVSSNFEMITMKRPLEGKWEILFNSGKNNKAYVITNLNLQTNFNELYPLFGQTLDIKLWLEREDKRIVEKEVLEKIVISIELSKPDGETIHLQPFDKGDGILEKKIELYKAGNYKLRFVADGKTFQREKTFAFKVSDVKESQEDIEFRQSLIKPDEPAKSTDTTDDEVRWGKVIAQFLIINLVLGIALLAYIKLGNLKNINMIKRLLKKTPKELVQHELKENETDQILIEEEKEPAEVNGIQENKESKDINEEKRAIVLDEQQDIQTEAIEANERQVNQELETLPIQPAHDENIVKSQDELIDIMNNEKASYNNDLAEHDTDKEIDEANIKNPVLQGSPQSADSGPDEISVKKQPEKTDNEANDNA